MLKTHTGDGVSFFSPPLRRSSCADRHWPAPHTTPSPLADTSPPFAENRFRRHAVPRIVMLIPSTESNMKRDLKQHWRRQLVWGIAHIWQCWPVLVAVFGVSNMIPTTTPRLFLSGLGEVMLAA